MSRAAAGGAGSPAAGERSLGPEVYRAEIASAIRYERGLVGKLAIALLVVALVIVARIVFFG